MKPSNDEWWAVEISYRHPKTGVWAAWEERRIPTSRTAALAWLRERTDLEVAQDTFREEVGASPGENSNRHYRLRNTMTGEIITPDQLRFIRSNISRR
jgi:hypothetical protein